jgi:putative transposase
MAIATGVRADGWREVLAFAVADSEDGAIGPGFLRSLKARRLVGVQFCIRSSR